MSDSVSPCIETGAPLEGMEAFESINDIIAEACRRFVDHPAFSCLGHTLSYRDVDRLSGDFAAWLQQETDLEPGARIAIQLPTVLQFPVAVFGALRAGLVVVNTNPSTPSARCVISFAMPASRRWWCWPTWPTSWRRCSTRPISAMST